ncbi:MAG: FAD:protein FMN transferase [Nitrospirota bacterium]|nr:MAG: FAD:protein FMN transferase [Nitrospirota bacterium]
MRSIRYRPFLATVMIIALISGCSLGGERIYTDSRIAMDTIVTISVVSDSSKEASVSINKVFGEITKLSELANFYSEKSELTAVNLSAGKKPVKVSPELFEIIRLSLDIAGRTGGAFDPTMGAVTALWDFHDEVLPDDTKLNEKAKLVSYKSVVLNDKKGTVFLKKEGMKIDLGGIAKGYAADIAIDLLKGDGIESALVSVAGDIRAYGSKPDGSPWMIGIRDPRPASPTENILAALPLQEMAISTSGDYQRFFIREGTRYHHLLSPKNGRPVKGTQSVSIISDKAVITDSMATAVFIMGPEKGLKFADKMGYLAVIVDDNGRIYISEGLRDVIEIKRPE